jgi:DNA adenine methylase
MNCTRPALRYMGGKWRLAPWILSHFPAHRIYVEPYGGAASVLIRKERAYAEVYNDLNGEVVDLFRILRDPDQAERLARLVEFTPYARGEFERTYEVSADPLENARRLVARSFMGHGSTAISLRRRTGFRADSRRSGKHPACDWASLAPALRAIAERFKGVVIEQRPALSIMERFDGDRTLHYVDPPYPHDTRSRKRIRGQLEHAYAHEMTDDEHVELARFLGRLDGFVVLSGYANALYDRELAGWRRVEKATYADGARPRVESLWLNARLVSHLDDPARRPVPISFLEAAE